MRARGFCFRLLRKVLLTFVGAVVLYKVLYYTGIWAVMVSLYHLAQRSGLGNIVSYITKLI